jgi:hypothetical protein
MGVNDGLDSVSQSKLGQDPGDVGLDGFVPNEQVCSDFGVAEAGGEQQDYFLLAGGEAVEIR